MNTSRLFRYRSSLPNGPRVGAGNPLFAFLAILWLGMLLGVVFIATPVKFQAPSLDMSRALEVGRVTFALFSKIEWGLFALLLGSLFFRRTGWDRWLGLGVLLAVLLLENLWLLPVLDERAGQVIAGTKPAESWSHFFYVAAESVKGLVLLMLSVGALRR